MSKNLSNSLWLSLCFLLLPICLSANKYPPIVDKYLTKLETNQGMDRIETLAKLIQVINSYDTLAAQRYLNEADSLIHHFSFSEEEKLKGKRTIFIAESWVHFNNSKFHEAFKVSLETDSVADQLAVLRDSFDDYIYTTYLNSNTIRAAIYSNQKQYFKSQREFEQSINICKKMEDKYKLGSTFNNLGLVLMFQEKFEAAEQVMLKADSIYTARNDEWDLAYCTLLRVDLYRESEQWEKGQKLIERGRKYVKEQVPTRLNILNTYAAEIALGLGQKEKSDSLLAVCLQNLEEIKEPAVLAEIKEIIADIYKKQGKFEEAINFSEDSEEESEVSEESLRSKPLFELQERYEQSKFNQKEAKNSTSWWWLLLGLIPFGIGFYFLFRKSEPVEPTSHTLEIAWKDESLMEQKDPFFERFIDLVQNQMEDGDVSVDGISEQMRISRVQLFKKIKATTGKSPSQVIRKIRLETAERLLIENNSTVSEIAYRVGFSSPNNFSRSFKDYFGETPKSYQAKKLG